MSKQEKYQAKGQADDLEGLSERLAVDLRKSIRGLGNHAIFSDAWIEMATTCGRIAKISDMESTVAASKADATLWETEEQALRYLLEDGKLNLCLRNMVAYKANQRDRLRNKETITPEQQVAGDAFEKGLGTVLRNAWGHLEALQTTDIPALIAHMGDVITFAVVYPEHLEEQLEDLHQRQEILIYYYLAGLLKATSQIDESRVMPLVREHKIFILTVKLVVLLHGFNTIATSYLFKCCEALAMIVDTEDFKTYPQQYYDLQDADDVSQMMKLLTICTQEFQGEAAYRSAVRPLTDTLNKVKRQAARK